MNVITMPGSISGYANVTSIGAAFVAQIRENTLNLLQNSDTLGFTAKGTFQQLEEIFDDCSSEGWDGGRAKPISKEVLSFAAAFLKTFPVGIEAPEVGAEPDGAITLEWYKAPNRVISVSINSDGWIYYAAIIGTSRRHGTDYALFGVSEDILSFISQVTKDN